jgi:3-methyladenine DNA glycosylase Tag
MTSGSVDLTDSRLVGRDVEEGYRFVGPTSVYAFMQNVGVVNDHVRACFRATDYVGEHGR